MLHKVTSFELGGIIAMIGIRITPLGAEGYM